MFLSGQVGNRPEHPTTLVEGGLEAETRQIFANLGHVLKVREPKNIKIIVTWEREHVLTE